MNIKDIAQVIEELYYNGRATVSKKLDMRDFLMLARMANGTIMRKLYYEEKQNGQHNWFFGSQVFEKEFKVSEPNKKGVRFITIKEGDEFSDDARLGVIRMPHDSGILLIQDVDGDGDDIARSEPGSDWLYTGPAFDSKPFWTRRGDRIALHNIDDCVTTVEVIGIFDDKDMDIPYDVAFDIVLQVMSLALKVINVPVDKTNDDDPNTQMIKKQLNSLP